METLTISIPVHMSLFIVSSICILSWRFLPSSLLSFGFRIFIILTSVLLFPIPFLTCLSELKHMVRETQNVSLACLWVILLVRVLSLLQNAMQRAESSSEQL